MTPARARARLAAGRLARRADSAVADSAIMASAPASAAAVDGSFERVALEDTGMATDAMADTARATASWAASLAAASLATGSRATSSRATSSRATSSRATSSRATSSRDSQAHASMVGALANATRMEGGQSRASRVVADSPIPPTAVRDSVDGERPSGADAQDMEALPRPLSPGTLVGGRYTIEARIGTGAFGGVYRARDTMVTGHVVALKLHHHAANDPVSREAAMRELRVIASVFHPSVVQYKDHGWYRGRLWFVMPHYPGETLEDCMARRPLTCGEAYQVFEPLARALSSLHGAGIRHQDIKPENIFLAQLPGRGEEVLPVLLDLGVAATDAERVMGGTPPYFAPEVAAFFAYEGASASDVGPEADVFSLALSLRNALEPATADEPECGEDLEGFIARRAARVPSPPSGAGLRHLAPSFRRWLHPDPAQRPTAEVFARELRLLQRTRPGLRRRVSGALVLAAAVAVCVLGTLFESFGGAQGLPSSMSARLGRELGNQQNALRLEGAATVEDAPGSSLSRDVRPAEPTEPGLGSSPPAEPTGPGRGSTAAGPHLEPSAEPAPAVVASSSRARRGAGQRRRGARPERPSVGSPSDAPALSEPSAQAVERGRPKGRRAAGPKWLSASR